MRADMVMEAQDPDQELCQLMSCSCLFLRQVPRVEMLINNWMKTGITGWSSQTELKA